MTVATIVGLIILAVSPFAARAVGRRMHDDTRCPVCHEEAEYRRRMGAEARRRHPTNYLLYTETEWTTQP